MLGSQWSTLSVSRRFSCRGAEAFLHDHAVQQTVAVHVVVYVPVYRSCIFPCRGAEADLDGLAVADHRFSPLRVDKVVDALVMQILLLPHIPVVAQRQFPMVLRTMEIPQLHVDKVFDVLVCRW